MSELINGAQAAEFIGVSRPTFYRLVDKHPELAPEAAVGAIKGWKLSAIQAWLRQRDREEKERRKALVEAWAEG